MDERGSRPIANSPDEFHLIRLGDWHGWPDYTGGLPVTMPIFKPEGKPHGYMSLEEFHKAFMSKLIKAESLAG